MTTSLRLPRFALSAAAAAVLAGCAVAPPPQFTQDELLQKAESDHRLMFAAQEPVTAPITLDEAIARALKYNLQQRLALMERALEDRLTDVQGYGMLPQITAHAGLRTRSNQYGSSSESLTTGKQSLETSTSQERQGKTADLQMTWNVLDFGLSYFGAKVQGNKALAAEERRRRVVSDIIRETRAAYWNAVTAERLAQQVQDAQAQASRTLEQAREVQSRRLMSPIAALRYQRDLLNLLRQTESLGHELAQAKARLAALMNLAPGTPFTLAAPSGESLQAPKLAYELNDLEALAMVRRPEIREEAYLARNAVLETRMSMLRLFPNVALFGGVNYDGNKYLANHHWADAGLQVSWNLLGLAQMPALTRAGEAREEVADLRRQALRMTVLTQVHVAWLERERAATAFARAQELSRLQSDIRQQTENAAQSKAETQLELVRARVEALLAERARDVSYAELVNAQNTVYQAAGLDALPDQIADASIAGLAREVAETNRLIERGHVDVPRLAQFGTDKKAAPVQVAAAPAPVKPQPLPALRQVAGRPWEMLGSLARVQEDVSEPYVFSDK